MKITLTVEGVVDRELVARAVSAGSDFSPMQRELLGELGFSFRALSRDMTEANYRVEVDNNLVLQVRRFVQAAQELGFAIELAD